MSGVAANRASIFIVDPSAAAARIGPSASTSGDSATFARDSRSSRVLLLLIFRLPSTRVLPDTHRAGSRWRARPYPTSSRSRQLALLRAADGDDAAAYYASLLAPGRPGRRRLVKPSSTYRGRGCRGRDSRRASASAGPLVGIQQESNCEDAVCAQCFRYVGSSARSRPDCFMTL